MRPGTLAVYRSFLEQQLKPRLGKRRLQTIDVDTVAAVIASLQKGERFTVVDGRTTKVEGKPFAARSIRGMVVVLGLILGAAARAGIIAANPVTKLERRERPKVTRREIPSLDRDAVGRLIAGTEERYRTLVALSVLTGIRQSEALALTFADVDTKAGVVHVRHQLSRAGKLVEPKTEAARREIEIPPSLGRLLAARKEEAFARGQASPAGFVFADETGAPLSHGRVGRVLARALAAAGLPELCWHDLRHVAASALIAQGVSVTYLSRLLGHASPAVTLAVYAHEFAKVEQGDRMREQMEAAYGGLFG